MNPPHTVSSALFGVLFCAGAIAAPQAESSHTSPIQALAEKASAAPVRLSEDYGKLPLSFEVNQGQSSQQVEFISRGQGYTLFLTPTEAVLSLIPPAGKGAGDAPAGLAEKSGDAGAVVRMTLIGAHDRPKLSGIDKLPGQSHYFIGNDPKDWHTDVSHYAKVKYQGVYPGIDLVYYGKQQQLEYDFIVAPGVDPNIIKLAFQGVDRMEINPQGHLVLHTAQGELKQHKPIIYQEIEGERKLIDGKYVLFAAPPRNLLAQEDKRNGIGDQDEGAAPPVPAAQNKGEGNHQVGFQVASYDVQKPLVIDPVLTYSTYLGGSGRDEGRSIAVDGAGNAYVTGLTTSTNFPDTVGAFDTGFNGDRDAFVTKLNAAGNGLAYSTFLGGSDFDDGQAIAVDGAGNTYIAGITRSGNFPAPNGLQTSSGGGQDAFFAKLNPLGSQLLYSTYLGGSGEDFGYGVAVDGSGNAYVGGHAEGGFPTSAGAFQESLSGSRDGFVTKIDPTQSDASSMIYSSYLGGRGAPQRVRGIIVDGGGNAYITGFTESGSFPTTTGAFQVTKNNLSDVFVTKFNAAGTGLIYSTLLGGNGFDEGRSIAVDSDGNAYITGFTQSTDFPRLGALQSSYGGDSGGANTSTNPFAGDAFVTKLDASGTALIYSTFLGGAGDDVARGIAVDSAGNAHVAGETDSINFPNVDTLQEAGKAGGFDAFVSKLDATGSALIYSTFLGGSGDDEAYDITLDNSGNAFVTGETESSNFPTTLNAFDRTFGGGGTTNDAFIARISDPSTTTMGSLQFGMTSFSVNEGGNATITVTREGGSDGVVSITFDTSNGTATAGSDYTAVNDVVVSFADNDTAAKTVTVSTADNGDVGDETVNLVLSGPTGGATLGAPGVATLTIVDNDGGGQPPPSAGTLQFSMAAYQVGEGDGNAVITVTRAGGSDGAASVTFRTVSGGTAAAGSDFNATTMTINFADGDGAPKTVSVPIIDDTEVEGNETVNLALSGATGATIGTRGTAVLTIVENDEAPNPGPGPGPEPEPEPPPPPPDDSGGGGGGCAINLDAAPDPSLPLLLMLSALYMLRRRQGQVPDD